MGITSLSHLRASSLQELIYKQGQSGVHKASVMKTARKITVTRQILTGGRSKYLVNGHVSQPTAVQNLFQSVQLNVNNPHFLIMQGRITKVINMKPQEVVAMIEEAAGTRMYEMKREAALKTISKKDKKLEEIDELFFQNQILQHWKS
ncbi:Structural maintenance of chromosomes protein 2-1 [Galdieria sulphuraria]|nr:Structural maintenance of chromosomes protein 2-1 [Galdieria sulphuraria]